MRVNTLARSIDDLLGPAESRFFGRGYRSVNYQRGEVTVRHETSADVHRSAVNTAVGLQDAVNLGWKLAGVAQGRYPIQLLDSYDTDRRPAVESVSTLSTKLAQISLYSSRSKIVVRDTAYRIGTVTNTLETVLAPRLAQLDTHYASTKRRRDNLAPGQRLPLGWRPSPTAPLLDIDSYTILLWPGHAYRSNDWAKLVKAVRTAATDAAVRDLAGNPLGDLGARLPSGAVAITSRPDGHIADVTPLSTDDIPRSITSVIETIPIRPDAISPSTFLNHPPAPNKRHPTEKEMRTMTQRVTLPEVEDMTPGQAAVYERFQSNLTRALLLTAGSAAPHLALGASFTVGALETIDREVIVLRVAHLLDSDFEKMLHYPIARGAGLSDNDITLIENAQLDQLDPRRAAIVDYVTDCTIDHKASERTFWKLREFLSEREIADATHLAGHCAMTAMYLASLDIPLDTTETSWGRLTELKS